MRYGFYEDVDDAALLYDRDLLLLCSCGCALSELMPIVNALSAPATAVRRGCSLHLLYRRNWERTARDHMAYHPCHHGVAMATVDTRTANMHSRTHRNALTPASKEQAASQG